MSIKVGITGGIGSGKSVVAALLATMGIPVYNCDTEAKALMNSDLVIHHELTALFGKEAYKESVIDKKYLASRMFDKPDMVKRVNAIVHPRVREHLRGWLKEHDIYKVVGVESAILIEAGFSQEVDKILLVQAPLELRIKRAVKRDNVSEESVMKRIRNQMDEGHKKLMADYVIDNGEEIPLLPQIVSFLEELQREKVS